MSLSSTFIRRPIGTSLLALAIFLVGAAVWPLLPVAAAAMARLASRAARIVFMCLVTMLVGFRLRCI